MSPWQPLQNLVPSYYPCLLHQHYHYSSQSPLTCFRCLRSSANSSWRMRRARCIQKGSMICWSSLKKHPLTAYNIVACAHTHTHTHTHTHQAELVLLLQLVLRLLLLCQMCLHALQVLHVGLART